jgi:AcrR family transcriptional regulator
MSYIVERRSEEKERRRAEILDAAEALYAKTSWDAVTIDQVARGARLSRALIYVYFRDKEELLFGIGQRAMYKLRDRFAAASVRPVLGVDKVQALGRAYMSYAIELPYYFDVCTRFNSHMAAADDGSNASACEEAGNLALAEVVKAIEIGKQDGSIRADIGDSMALALTFWAFTHGIIQIAMAKGESLGKFGLSQTGLADYAFRLMDRMARGIAGG